MKTRIIHTKIHGDKYFRSLQDDRKQSQFLFYLTNDRIGLSGIYECPTYYIRSFKPHWSEESIIEINKEFEEAGKFFFYEDWIVVANHYKYNSYTGSLNEKAVSKEIEDTPTILLERVLERVSDDYGMPMHSLINKKLEIRNKKQEIKTQKSEINNQKLEIRNKNGIEDLRNKIKGGKDVTN